LSERPLISVVDDDQSFGDSMGRLLKALDYSVAVFPSAAQFLASAQLAATACLVADIHMPEMTGVELYNHLVESGHAIPTILVTADPDERPKECMLAQGVECYLRKPLVEAALIDCIRTAVAHGLACRGSRRV
jgi:FixJ family two-component response regulator